MKSKFGTGVLLLLVWAVAACASPSAYLSIEKTPASNYEEIHVDKAYDFVYLSVFDVVNALDGWTPEVTRKDEGLIRLHNTQSGRLDNSSLRAVNIRIRRDNQTQTSVFLDSDSTRVIGADEVLAAIRKKLGMITT